MVSNIGYKDVYNSPDNSPKKSADKSPGKPKLRIKRALNFGENSVSNKINETQAPKIQENKTEIVEVNNLSGKDRSPCKPKVKLRRSLFDPKQPTEDKSLEKTPEKRKFKYCSHSGHYASLNNGQDLKDLERQEIKKRKLDLSETPTGNHKQIQFKGSDIRKDDKILISKGENLVLDELGKGNFHRVWTVNGKPTIVIKTFSGNLEDNKRTKSIENTMAAYKTLIERETTRGDIQVARLYNDVRIDNFYVFEKIPGDAPSFDEVKPILIDMIKDHNQFIADFRPDNARMKDGKIVIIDPYADHEEDIFLNLFHIIKSWVTKDKILDKEKLLLIVDEFDALNLKPDSKEKMVWDFVSKRLREIAST